MAAACYASGTLGLGLGVYALCAHSSLRCILALCIAVQMLGQLAAASEGCQSMCSLGLGILIILSDH